MRMEANSTTGGGWRAEQEKAGDTSFRCVTKSEPGGTRVERLLFL